MQSTEQLLVFGEGPQLWELLQGVAEAVVGLLDSALLVQRHAIVVQLVQQGEPSGQSQGDVEEIVAKAVASPELSRVLAGVHARMGCVTSVNGY